MTPATLLLLQTLSGFADAGFASDTHGRFHLAQLQWSRGVSETQPFGFTLSAIAGGDADSVHAGEPSDTFRHIDQASLAYRLRSGIVLEAGIYPSHIGFESFHSKDDWNYTRGIVAEMSPYYQAGIKASYAFDAHWSGQVHALDGWQRIDGDIASAFGTQIAYAIGPLSAAFNTYVDSDRRFGDLVVVWQARPRWQFAATADAGSDDAHGVAAYARFTINSRHAIATRLEAYRDLREGTLTYELRPHPHLILKGEARHDTEPSHFLAVAGAVVTF